MIVSLNEMNDYLHRGECAVKFMKSNGEERLMACTLRADLMPSHDSESTSSDSTKSQDRVIVWDLDKEAFRSFRLDSIIWVIAPENANDDQ